MGKIGIGDKHEGNMGESHGMHSWECGKDFERCREIDEVSERLYMYGV